MRKKFVSAILAALAFSVFFAFTTDAYAAKDGKKKSAKSEQKEKERQDKKASADHAPREPRVGRDVIYFDPSTMIDWDHPFVFSPLKRQDDYYNTGWYKGRYNGNVFISVHGWGERDRFFGRNMTPVSIFQIHRPETRLDYLADKKNGWKEKKDPKYQEFWPSINNSGNELTRAFFLYGATGSVWKDNDTEKWLKINFSFRPRKDGFVAIFIGHDGFPAQRLPKEKADPTKDYAFPPLTFVGYANFKAEGTTIENPNFSNLSGWGIDEKTASSFRIETRTDASAPGGRYLYTCGGIKQLLKVQKDKKVTISFYVRYFDYYKPNKKALDKYIKYWNWPEDPAEAEAEKDAKK